jgi:hypothetical protein
MDKQLITVSGVSGYIDENGIAQLNLKNVAMGLGFTEVAASGNETFRWRTIRGYLSEFGIATFCDDSLPEFIPENIFYRLAFKASNKTAVDFQCKVADEILPQIRKTGTYSIKPVTALDFMEYTVKAMKDQQQALADTNKRIDNIGDIIALDTRSWREDARKLIVRIAQRMGSNEYIRDINAEVYKLIDKRGGKSLKTRLTNMRCRMADDKVLIELYVAIVKEMAVKHGLEGAEN